MAWRFEDGTIGDIVSSNYQAAAVFERYGLKFCCEGRTSLVDACERQHIDMRAVAEELERLGETAPLAVPTEPGELVKHIVAEHHAYVRSAIPVITNHLAKVVAAHGHRHPETTAIAEHFDTVARELTLHMMKEEQVLFPYVTALARPSNSARHLHRTCSARCRTRFG